MITSTTNPHVKDLLRLRRRRTRDQPDAVLVEGYREVRRAVGVLPIRTLYYSSALWLGDDEPALLASAAGHGADLVEMAEAPFRRVSTRDRPDGILAVGTRSSRSLDSLPLGPHALVLVVESVEKPGNLGTILRTADAAGVSAVVVCDPATDPFGPHVVRASLGCVFVVPLVVTDSWTVLRWLSDSGIRAVAATPSAQRCLWEADLRGPCAIAVGNERAGLSSPWLTTAAERVRIPMAGSADSLNVAMAATSMLFEAVRQRTFVPRARNQRLDAEPHR